MGNVSLKVLERSLTFLFKKGTNPVSCGAFDQGFVFVSVQS